MTFQGTRAGRQTRQGKSSSKNTDASFLSNPTVNFSQCIRKTLMKVKVLLIIRCRRRASTIVLTVRKKKDAAANTSERRKPAVRLCNFTLVGARKGGITKSHSIRLRNQCLRHRALGIEWNALLALLKLQILIRLRLGASLPDNRAC